jgi:hypothetical protein
MIHAEHPFKRLGSEKGGSFALDQIDAQTNRLLRASISSVTVSARTLKTRFGGFFHFRLPHRRNGPFIVQ